MGAEDNVSRVILVNKPYDVLCQFTDGEGRRTLAECCATPGVYPVGRLDRDSEGLLILTDDGALQHRLAHPSNEKEKGYWAQVEGVPSEAALAALRAGVLLDGQRTAPSRCERIEPPDLWPRDPPIRVRQSIPDTWIALWLTEGKNRQVRRMTAAVGHPTLRLVRFAIGPLRLDGLAPGATRALQPAEVEALWAAAKAGPQTKKHEKRSGSGRKPSHPPRDTTRRTG